jgi:hypothetical protein
MASKRRVAVLEAHEAPDAPAQIHCGTGIAEYLVNESYAEKIGKRLIRMVKLTAAQAITLAKAAREQAIKMWERAQLRLGVGNVVPFSRPTDPGHHFHYEIPHANDKGIRRWGFRSRASKRNEKLETRTIKVSARPQRSIIMPAIAAPTFACGSPNVLSLGAH